jgi:hypothetical protein
VRDKRRKHTQYVWIQRVTVRSMCESYYMKDAERVGHLRVDTLAEVCARSNARYGSRVLVLDMVLVRSSCPLINVHAVTRPH